MGSTGLDCSAPFGREIGQGHCGLSLPLVTRSRLLELLRFCRRELLPASLGVGEAQFEFLFLGGWFGRKMDGPGLSDGFIYQGNLSPLK